MLLLISEVWSRKSVVLLNTLSIRLIFQLYWYICTLYVVAISFTGDGKRNCETK